jgi:hypothetical protein
MGYLKHAGGVTRELIGSATFEIEIAGERHTASASLQSLQSFYDPGRVRARA